MDLISNEALTQTLRELICRHGGTSQYAKYLGVSCAFVSRMASGQRYISGRVLDSGGAPVAGAKVTCEAYRTDEQTLLDDTQGAVPAALGETATDAAGRFQVKLEKPGIEVSIRVMPGALPGALLGGPYDSSEDVALDDVELPAVEKISGRVSDESGKPVAGARVRATGGLGFQEEDVLFYAEAKSAGDGAYSIPNAPANAGGLSVRAAGYSPSRQASMQRRTTVNVTLKESPFGPRGIQSLDRWVANR